MTDKRQESPVKSAPLGVAFRFRPNEEELEELSIEEEKQEEQSSIQENFSKLFDQLPRKLLTKNHSQSDSEDTSESSKLSEWWKETDESRCQRIETITGAFESEYGIGRRLTVNSVPDIKIAQGRITMKEIQGEVESGIEVGEEMAASTASTLSSTPLVPQPPATYPSAPPSPDPDPPPAGRSTTPMTAALRGVLTYCTPIVFAAWFNVSEFWTGVLFGVCIFGLSRVLWQLIEDVLSEPSEEPEKGPFRLPHYNLLPPLKTPNVPIDKRGCFNVYSLPYDPDTYAVSQTRPVCLELEGSLLRLTKVKTKLAKRAHFSQPDYELDYSKKAEYDLTRCTVQLLPEGLARKRWYSKKYPIAVNLGEEAILNFNQERYHVGYDGAFYSASEKEDSDSDTEGGVASTSSKIKLASPVLYLFARCDRDKEDWYRRLLAAAAPSPDETNLAVDADEAEQSSLTDKNEEKEKEGADPATNLSLMEEYMLSLSKFVDVPPHLIGNTLLRGEAEMEIDVDSLEVQWLNAFIGRILFDIFRSPYWLNKIQEKLQKKLSALKRPEYVGEMEITEMELGREGPTIHRVSRPVVDERGLWFDLDLSYKGTMCCTIQTKLNLMRAHREELKVEEDITVPDKMRSPVFDSEMEDTAESSTDDEEEDETNNPVDPPVQEPEVQTPGPNSSSKKKVKSANNFLRFVENVAKSKAFQHVAQTKMMQKVIEGVSQTKLQLQVQVNGIVGTMAVNIPPPPSDRLWYGFRGMPKIWLKAKPLVGEWNVKFPRVTSWIERKLIKEFQYILVLPHMKPIMLPTIKVPVADPPQTEETENIAEARVSVNRHTTIWRKNFTEDRKIDFAPITSPFDSSVASLIDGLESRGSVDFDKIHEEFEKEVLQRDGSLQQGGSVSSEDIEVPRRVTAYFWRLLQALNEYDYAEENASSNTKVIDDGVEQSVEPDEDATNGINKDSDNENVTMKPNDESDLTEKPQENEKENPISVEKSRGKDEMSAGKKLRRKKKVQSESHVADKMASNDKSSEEREKKADKMNLTTEHASNQSENTAANEEGSDQNNPIAQGSKNTSDVEKEKKAVEKNIAIEQKIIPSTAVNKEDSDNAGMVKILDGVDNNPIAQGSGLNSDISSHEKREKKARKTIKDVEQNMNTSENATANEEGSDAEGERSGMVTNENNAIAQGSSSTTANEKASEKLWRESENNITATEHRNENTVGNEERNDNTDAGVAVETDNDGKNLKKETLFKLELAGVVDESGKETDNKVENIVTAKEVNSDYNKAVNVNGTQIEIDEGKELKSKESQEVIPYKNNSKENENDDDGMLGGKESELKGSQDTESEEIKCNCSRDSRNSC